MDKLEEFHNHLDECEQCNHNPFNLCLKGEQLLVEFALWNEEKNERLYAPLI